MNAPVAGILFAAAIDWLESLLPFLFVGFWILSQVFAIFRRVAGGGDAAQGNGGVRPRPPAAPEARPQLRDDLRDNLGDNLRDERRDAGRDDLQKQIEEFLRQSTGERPAQARPVAQPKPVPLRPAVAKPTPPTTPPALPDRAAAPRAGVERPVGSFAAGKTDVARHVQDAFAHDLKHARPGMAPAATALRAGRPARAGQAATAVSQRSAKLPVSTAAELLEALRTPATIRQTILLREVLERPVDRW